MCVSMYIYGSIYVCKYSYRYATYGICKYIDIYTNIHVYIIIIKYKLKFEVRLLCPGLERPKVKVQVNLSPKITTN